MTFNRPPFLALSALAILFCLNLIAPIAFASNGNEEDKIDIFILKNTVYNDVFMLMRWC